MTQQTPIVESLSRLLADTCVPCLRTHDFHWNVTGPMFTTLHTPFETEYTELARDQAKVVAAARNVVNAAEGAGDDATADLGIRRIQVHEKNAWMLASHLELEPKNRTAGDM